MMKEKRESGGGKYGKKDEDMCRIAGLVRLGGKNLESDVLRMRDAMRHGGPDDAGVFISEKSPIALAHRRLAIIDPSAAGHQPMRDVQHDLVITFNGEIYNFRELKAELSSLGYLFESKTDTEVILKAYAAWGVDCFKQFNGMFAFALLDQRQNLLYLVRDPVGIKPLYYHSKDREMVFASEIRAFRALQPEWPENSDWRIFFLTFGHLPEPVTTLRDVSMLPAGHFLQYNLDQRQATLTPYQQWTTHPVIDRESEATEILHETILEATNAQLVSDVPIGLFLSGGIDSSILALAAHTRVSTSLYTTSLIFEEKSFTEKTFQDIIVQATGAHHTAVKVSRNDFESAFDDILAAMDQPTNDGINSYFVCHAARAAGLTVALSGIGADELFGGYPSFDYARYVAPLRQLPARALRALCRTGGDRWKKISFLALPGPVGEYLFYRGLFAPADVAQLCGTTEKAVIDCLQSLPLDSRFNTLTNGERVSWIEMKYYLQNQLLKDTDVMSMWHSLEVRVPFLDKSVLDLAGRISSALKFGHPRKKNLLIQAFQAELPRAIWDRPKQGFTFPFESWFKASEHLNNARGNLEPYLQQFQRGELSWARLWVWYLAQHYK